MTKINYIKDIFFVATAESISILNEKLTFSKKTILNVNKFLGIHYINIDGYHSQPIKNDQITENKIYYFYNND